MKKKVYLNDKRYQDRILIPTKANKRKKARDIENYVYHTRLLIYLRDLWGFR